MMWLYSRDDDGGGGDVAGSATSDGDFGGSLAWRRHY